MQITPDAPPEIIIEGDDLDRLPSRIEEIMAFYRGAGYWPEHGRRIARSLQELIGRSTTLLNPLVLQIAEEETDIVRLTEEQFRILDVMRRNRRVAIGGCAGSGKTFLAVEKAPRLAAEGYRTLLTCYHRPLAEYLRHVTAGIEGLDVMNFHMVCTNLARKAGLDIPEGSGEEHFGTVRALELTPARQRTRWRGPRSLEDDQPAPVPDFQPTSEGKTEQVHLIPK